MLKLSTLPNRWINVTALVSAVLRVRPAAQQIARDRPIDNPKDLG